MGLRGTANRTPDIKGQRETGQQESGIIIIIIIVIIIIKQRE